MGLGCSLLKTKLTYMNMIETAKILMDKHDMTVL